MTTLKLSAATCALGVIFLSAAPAYSGLGPHGLATVAPSSGQVESGEVASNQTASADERGFRIAPPGSHPNGKGYPAWIEAWTRWAVETKGSQHPLLDTTRDCSV